MAGESSHRRANVGETPSGKAGGKRSRVEVQRESNGEQSRAATMFNVRDNKGGQA